MKTNNRLVSNRNFIQNVPDPNSPTAQNRANSIKRFPSTKPNKNSNEGSFNLSYHDDGISSISVNSESASTTNLPTVLSFKNKNLRQTGAYLTTQRIKVILFISKIEVFLIFYV